jgi:hypothetical protein
MAKMIVLDPHLHMIQQLDPPIEDFKIYREQHYSSLGIKGKKNYESSEGRQGEKKKNCKYSV